MKGKLVVIISSLLVSFLLMSGGYSLWQDKLTIDFCIDVVEPEKETQNIDPMSIDLYIGGSDGGGENLGSVESESGAEDRDSEESNNSSVDDNSSFESSEAKSANLESDNSSSTDDNSSSDSASDGNDSATE